MSYQMVAIIGLMAWAVLAVSALRARRLGTQKTLQLVAIWAAIILVGWALATVLLRVHPVSNFT